MEDSLAPKHRSRVVAVIPAFNPDATLMTHARALAPQVARVIVVDDGSSSESSASFGSLEDLGVEVLRLQENGGIGRAINKGLERAKELATEFIVTFDQDSEVPPRFVDALVDEFDRLTAAGVRVGMVGPEFFSATKQSRDAPKSGMLEAQTLIQSGMLMPMSAVEEIGAQREDFFIDLIDTEYFYRCLSMGFAAVCVEGLNLPHGFGHRLYVHSFGRRLKKRNGQPRRVAVSSPFRYYYRARNRIFLNQEFSVKSRFRKELRRQTVRDILFDFAVAVYSARGKLLLMRVMFAGWQAGFRGKTGRMPDRIMELASRVSWRHPTSTD